jgi:hypothetical protein
METIYVFAGGSRDGLTMRSEGELITLVRSGLEAYALDDPPDEVMAGTGFTYVLRLVEDPLPEARWSTV